MNITKLIEYEEGWRSRPYLCSEGYPTVGFGFKLGPKSAPLSQYRFTLPKPAGEAWLSSLLGELEVAMLSNSRVRAAMSSCNDARRAVLASMAYQMGVDGLSGFRNMLSAVADGRWDDAKAEMLDSRWAKQTPERAERHSNQMLSGEWFAGY